jgi:hypothetical protein
MTLNLSDKDARIILDALECLWSEHYIGNEEQTHTIRSIAMKLRTFYNIEKNEYEEF